VSSPPPTRTLPSEPSVVISGDPPTSEHLAPTASAPTNVAPHPSASIRFRDPERYQVLGEHGRGGLGRVSRVHDRELQRDVAIKELISRGPVSEVRFLREALITARLEHPGIVPVHEAGRWPDGTPFYAMKLVAGRPLRELIAERATVQERLGLLHHVIVVADAIAYAHGRNIIHRDLKPGNVIVGDFGETVVIDWGLAKDLGASDDAPLVGEPCQKTRDHDLTATGSVLGTPAYMPPEQARGEQVDQRADVFAIGAMLWELCSLYRVPPADRRRRHRLLRRAGIDQDLAVIIDKALEPERHRRYPDAGALAADLKAFKAGARIAARSYSLWAMLTHWTRRHRVLALSVSAAVVLATGGVIVFVGNIASARDRASAALVTAQQERDRARLSEASLLVESDPTRARDLLASLTLRTPQHALLTSRAEARSASHIVRTPAVIEGISRDPTGSIIDVRTRAGDLYRLNPSTGALERVDDYLVGPIAYRAGQSLRARKAPRSSLQTSMSMGPSLSSETVTDASYLVALENAIYVLGASGELHRLDGDASTVVARDVSGIAGDGSLLMTCKTNGELEILRNDIVTLRRPNCYPLKSPGLMVAVHDDYAVLTTDGTLIAQRRGQALEVRTEIHGIYELALSDRGVIAIADYSGGGKTWIVRPGGTTLELAAMHPAQPYSVAADGNLAAWGYTDGMVIALDTATGKTWKLAGHDGSVSHIAIDTQRARIVTASGRELRVWNLEPAPSSLVHASACSILQVKPSPDAQRAAMICGDGNAWMWTRDTGAVSKLHQHAGLAFGVQWVRNRACTGGWLDGQVRCTAPDGTGTQVLASGTDRITALTVTPDHHSLIFASRDGRIWRFDDELEELYWYRGLPSRMAISGDGRVLAWCALDGWFDVLDLAQRRLVAHLAGHAGATTSVAWVDDELWTSGNDGTIKRWVLEAGELRLRHSVQTAGAVRYLKLTRGGWAAAVGDRELLVSIDGASIALRLDVGRHIDALDVTNDLRYIAVAVNQELIIIDMQRDAVATLAISPPITQQVSFLDLTSLSFNEPGVLETVRVDRLHYVAFQPAPEPRNALSF
jgi:eukaryotic-like serine/threonine-protein kinase